MRFSYASSAPIDERVRGQARCGSQRVGFEWKGPGLTGVSAGALVSLSQGMGSDAWSVSRSGAERAQENTDNSSAHDVHQKAQAGRHHVSSAWPRGK